MASSHYYPVESDNEDILTSSHTLERVNDMLVESIVEITNLYDSDVEDANTPEEEEEEEVEIVQNKRK